MILLAPVLSVLRGIPWWAYALAACLAWGGWQRHRALSAAKVYQQAQIEAAKRTEAALAEKIRETARRLGEQLKVTQDAEAKTLKANAAAAATATANDKLRQRLVAIRAASAPAGNTTPAGAGTADRLADALGQCADKYRDVAAIADRSIIAGHACEASYQALIK